MQPPQPRCMYVTTWDVGIVVEYFKSMGQNDALSLKQKLALLTVLMEASRVPELQALDLRYHFY